MKTFFHRTKNNCGSTEFSPLTPIMTQKFPAQGMNQPAEMTGTVIPNTTKPGRLIRPGFTSHRIGHDSITIRLGLVTSPNHFFS